MPSSVERLEKLERLVPTLERTQQLLKAWEPIPFPSIHVTGTNGKGSVAHKIAYGLQASGLKVGLFTSPHLLCPTERIRINGAPIPLTLLESYLEPLFAHKLTFFEMVTGAMVRYFLDQQIDIAVLEAGIGGRLDATRALPSMMTAITSIGLDHTALLGPTRAAIALEKAALIAPGKPVVLGPAAQNLGIEEFATAQRSPIYSVQGPFQSYLEENEAIAQRLLKLLEIDVDTSAIQPSHRLDRRKLRGTEVVLDVAHNPDALRALLSLTPPSTILFGTSYSKDVDSMLELLRGHSLYLVDAPHERLVPSSELALRTNALGVPFCGLGDVRQVLDSLAGVKPVTICGSFFLMESLPFAVR